MNDPFARLGAAMVRLRWPVFLVWIILIPVAGGLGASKAASALKGGGFVVAGSESARAGDLLAREFNASSENNALLVFRSPAQTADDPAYQTQVAEATKRLEGDGVVAKALTFSTTRDPSLVTP